MLNKLVLILAGLMLSVTALAQETKPLDQNDIRQLLTAQGLSNEQANEVIGAINSKGVNSVSGALYTSYFNLGFFVDRDTLQMDANVKTDAGLVRIPKLVSTDFRNGGINIEIGYRWMYVFMTDGLTLKSVDGAQCGRGIALSLPVLALAGVEVGWMPCGNRQGHAFVVAGIAGATGGFNFPRVDFKVNPTK